MNESKKKILFLLSLLCCSLIVGSIGFSTVRAGSYADIIFNPTPDQVQYLWAIDPSSTTDLSAIYETFKPNSAGYLSTISVNLEPYGSPNAQVILGIYNLTTQDYTGTIDTLLQSSITTLNSTSIIGGNSWYSFTFPGDLQLSPSQYYCFKISILSATLLNTDNRVAVEILEGNSYPGYLWNYFSSTYHNISGDPLFLLILETESSATPTPGPTASVPDNISVIITTLVTTNNILLIIAFAIIIIGAILGAKFAGGWGFLAGLTVGVGLDFMFGLIAIWFVVLIGIVDAIALVRGINAARQDNGAA